MANVFREAVRSFALFWYSGVDPSIPGNGGQECYNFLSLKERIIDTSACLVLVIIAALPFVKQEINIPEEVKPRLHVKCRTGKSRIRKLLLIALCLTLGVELGYKFATNQLIFLLNPCHIITAVQVYLLAAEETRTVLVIFRIHLHLLFGAFLAIILPVVNARLLPGEVGIYWIQHILIFFVIPPYLISQGGVYTPEPLHDYQWVFLALGVFATHMFVILQGIGMLTLVNLNSMLCPAISDPFYGPYYRWYAIFHQSTLVLCFGKIYTLVVQSCLRLIKPESNKKLE
eukprot:gene11187-12361_t